LYRAIFHGKLKTINFRFSQQTAVCSECPRSFTVKFQELKARAFGLYDEMKALQEAVKQKKRSCNIQESADTAVEDKWR